MAKLSKIEGDYELVTEKVTLKSYFWVAEDNGLIGYCAVPGASEVDSGAIAGRMVACRHDPKRQHGHLLPQVSHLPILTLL